MNNVSKAFPLYTMGNKFILTWACVFLLALFVWVVDGLRTQKYHDSFFNYDFIYEVLWERTPLNYKFKIAYSEMIYKPCTLVIIPCTSATLFHSLMHQSIVSQSPSHSTYQWLPLYLAFCVDLRRHSLKLSRCISLLVHNMAPMHQLMLLFVAYSSTSHVPSSVEHKARSVYQKIWNYIFHESCTTNNLYKDKNLSYKIYEFLCRHFSTSKVAPWSYHYLYDYHTQTEYVKLNSDHSRIYIFWPYVPTAWHIRYVTDTMGIIKMYTCII